MLEETKGIILKVVKYSESSVICRIYTESFGVQSYIVNGVRKKRGKMSYFQKLNILKLIVYQKQKTGLNRVKDFELHHQLYEANYNPLKSIILIFLSEILQKCLKEEVSDKTLFTFLESSLVNFHQSGINNSFHLYFLIQLTDHLGFCPEKNKENHLYFDLINGYFCADKPEHNMFIEPPLTSVFSALMEDGFGVISHKREITSKLLAYYRLHVEGFGEVKCLETLKTILD